MNISKEIRDDLTAVITLNIAEEDYKPQVDQELKKYRANASVKGFRKGKAPLGLIKRMAGNSITVQEIDKLVSQSISDYLAKQDMDILGQPLPVKDQEPLDLDNKTEFDFSFEVGFTPDVEVSLDERTQIPYYLIKVDDEITDKEIKRMKEQYGKLEQIDEVTENAYIKADVVQSDAEGNILEECIQKEDTAMAVDLIKDDEIKEQFLGKKIGDTITADLKKAYPNDTELSSLLGIEKEQLNEIDPNFNITVNEITEFVPAELNQELFDKAFGEGEVNSEEEFKEKIKTNIADIYKKESDFRFSVDAKEKLIERFDPQLPDTFLKRWLLETDKEGKLTEEKLEEEYPKFAEDLKWRIITKNIAKEQDFEVEEEEIAEEARNFALMQLQQYGIDPSQMPPDSLDQFAQKNMEKPEDRERFAEKVIENKVVDFVKESVKLNEKEIDREEFKKLYE